MPQRDWKPLDPQLIELWGAGISAGNIGKRLGVSKNAVIGRVHRLGLPGRASPLGTHPAGVDRPTKHHERMPPARTKRVVVGGTLTILDLDNHTCRWPMGEPYAQPPYLYCGLEPEANSPYCGEHSRRAFTGQKAPQVVRGVYIGGEKPWR